MDMGESDMEPHKSMVLRKTFDTAYSSRIGEKWTFVKFGTIRI
jgi:hypothetical protein